MRKLFGKLFLTLAAMGIAVGQVHANVVTFDDLIGSGTLANGYGGINWDGHFNYYDSPQSPYNPASGLERAYPNYNAPGVPGVGVHADNFFSFPTPTVFDGAFFSGYGFGGPVFFDLYNGATLVSTSGSLFPTGTSTFLSSGYSGLVTSVGVNSATGYAVMDNVTYQGHAVPEPSSFALLGLGGIGLAIGAYRRRRATAI